MINLIELKIITGGQTGVDRAALDFCIKHDIKCGGFCPSGRLAEEGIIGEKYPLTELKNADYTERTIKNVVLSEFLLVLIKIKPDTGTQLAIKTAKENGIKFKTVFLPASNSEILNTRELMFDCSIINIAGPRESAEKGIYKLSFDFLEKLFYTNL